MSLITRFNGAFKAFASEATGTFRTVFGGTTQSNDLTDNLTNDFKTGWEIVGTNDEPTIEDFNAMGYTLSQVLAYIHQVGIIEWSGANGVIGGQDYYANKSYVGYGGDIYVALLNSGGSIEARVPTNATYWKKVSSAGLDINGQTNKTTPIGTDNFILQEVGGLFKKLSLTNLISTIMNVLNFPSGAVIQTQHYSTGAMSTGTSIIPNDNTIPQITEGTQFMSLTFTPKKENSKLKISVVTHVSNNNAPAVQTTALFDGSSNAVATSQVWNPNSAGVMPCAFICPYTVSSLSPITFSVRCGMDKSGTITFNGVAGAQLMGGSLASSITIEEIAQ